LIFASARVKFDAAESDKVTVNRGLIGGSFEDLLHPCTRFSPCSQPPQGVFRQHRCATPIAQHPSRV